MNVDVAALTRIRELEAEVEQLTTYSEVVADLCPEDLFNRIEGEWYSRMNLSSLEEQ